MRLVRIATDHWQDIDGWAVAHGMPPLPSLPLGRFVNFIWWWATRSFQEESEREKFRAALWRPPVGEVAERGPWSREGETRAFGALRAQLGR